MLKLQYKLNIFKFFNICKFTHNIKILFRMHEIFTKDTYDERGVHATN